MDPAAAQRAVTTRASVADAMTAAMDNTNDQVSVAVLLDALFTFVPGPKPDTKLSGVEIVARARRSGHSTLGESHLSQLRAGTARNPSFEVIAALAAAFHVDISFFTNGFHREHRAEAMRDRVDRARSDYDRLLRVAAEAYELHEGNRDAVLALIALLEKRERRG